MGLLRRGQVSDAEKAHREAFEEQSKLVKQFPDVAAYSFWLSLMQRSLGRALSEKGETAEAIKHLRAAVARAEALSKKDKRLGGTRPFLGMAYNDLAEALQKANDQKGAAEARRKAEEFGLPGGPGGRGPGRGPGGPPKGRGGKR
jgi:tetratricopeptide (TPR) repeat protein